MRALLILLAVLVAGCATAQAPTPAAGTGVAGVSGFATIARWGTWEMQTAPAYTRLALLRHRAARALNADAIGIATARLIQANADNVRVLLDRSKRAGAEPTAEQRADLAYAVEIMDRMEIMLGGAK